MCGYDGPLICLVALGCLTDVLGKEPPSNDITANIGDIAGSYDHNKMPSWSASTERDAGTATNDLLDYFVSRLSRQLQFPCLDAETASEFGVHGLSFAIS